jgi:DNA-binding CsgD family transcriptional regulator
VHTAAAGHPTRDVCSMMKVVDCIYAAACGETPWERTIAEVCQLGKLDGCALSMIDPLARRRVVLAAHGLGRAAQGNATVGPIPGNPKLMDRVLRSAPGAVWQDRQIRPDAPPATQSLRTGGTEPDGDVSWAGVIVGRDEGQVVCLEVHAGAGRPSDCPELDDFLRQLAPHLTRAWRLGTANRSMLARPSAAVSGSDAHTLSAPAPDLAGLPEVARLRAEFGLTKAEARLALRLAKGASLASAAQDFNVKLTTIRSQLQQVFAKTGTCRQTELVALLLSRGHGNQGPQWSPVKPGWQAAATAQRGA